MRPSTISIAATVLTTLSIAACERARDDDGRTQASSARLEPTLHEGYPTCADLGFAVEIEDRPVGIGPYSAAGVTVTVSNISSVFDWNATADIGAVVVFGGPIPNVSNVYVYEPASTGDTGLHAPINVPQGQGKPYGLYGIRFCFDHPPDGGVRDGGRDGGPGKGDAMAR